MELIKKKIYKNPTALTKIIDSNAIVILLNDEYDDSFKREVYCFNETGTIIWELIDEEKSLENITKKIYSEYDLNSQEIADCVEKFLNKLSEKKLINIRYEKQN